MVVPALSLAVVLGRGKAEKAALVLGSFYSPLLLPVGNPLLISAPLTAVFVAIATVLAGATTTVLFPPAP